MSRHNPAMRDERLLASLVLLLRLPTVGDNNPADISRGTNDSVVSQQQQQQHDHDAPSGSHGDGESSSALQLQTALEQNNCTLLCFVGRVIHQYQVCTSSSSAEYAHLRLAVRIAFLRYCTTPTPSVAVGSDVDGNGDVVNARGDENNVQNKTQHPLEYERCLLASIVEALRARISLNVEEVDVEMIWIIHTLLLKLSKHTHLISDDSSLLMLSDMWRKTIDALVSRKEQTKSNGGDSDTPISDVCAKLSSHKNDTALSSSDNPNNDEQMMIQTINAILDRSSSSSAAEEDSQDTNSWGTQYNIALVSCMQSFLQQLHCYYYYYSNNDDDGGIVMANNKRDGGGTLDHPRLTQQTLFHLIRWSQQKDSLSTEVYQCLLQYFHLCIANANAQRKNGQTATPQQQQRDFSQFYLACIDQEQGNDTSKTDMDEFTSAIRSFVFYGLVVLGNTAESTFATEAEPTPVSTSVNMRGDIYSLALELWQLFGHDWLIIVVPQSTIIAASRSPSSGWWWFQSGGNTSDVEHRLGQTWPLCTLVRLAAGEFRLALGRYVTKLEKGEASELPKENILSGGIESEIHPCARIVTEAVEVMTTIAEDENAISTWSPDAILHVRKSLEDALNSSVQYFTSEELLLGVTTPSRNDVCSDEVGTSCCLVMGTIAAELEVDHLLCPPISDDDKSSTNETKEESKVVGSSSFPHALRSSIMFCHALGEKRFGNDSDNTLAGKESSYEYQEPLTYLLPCIMSLVSNVSSDEEESKSSSIGEQLRFALMTLSKDNCLVLIISKLLNRASKQWQRRNMEGVWSQNPVDDHAAIEHADALVSLVKLCALIVNGSIAIIDDYSSKHCQEIKTSLELWRDILERIVDRCRYQALRSSAAQALDEVSQCLRMVL